MKEKVHLVALLFAYRRLLVECSHWFIERHRFIKLFTVRLDSHCFVRPLLLRGASHLQLQYDPRGAFVDHHCSANRKHHL